MQWLASGIVNAEAAEAEIRSYNENALALMNKALYCFKQASNEPFTKKAKIQLDSFNLRLKLFNAPRAGTFSDDKSRTKVEKEAVELFEKLLKENLLNEAIGLGNDMNTILESIYPSSAFLDGKILKDLKQKLIKEGYNCS